MTVRRRTVLEQLVRTSDAATRETTTTEALASTLDADERAVDAHIDKLVACELAHVEAGGVRATITGEELLALDTDEVVIVDPTAGDTTE